MIKEYQNGLDQLEQTHAKLDSIGANLEKKILKQINADYKNCILAREMAEESKDRRDISLFVWLVREFSDEVDSFDWFEKESDALDVKFPDN